MRSPYRMGNVLKATTVLRMGGILVEKTDGRFSA